MPTELDVRRMLDDAIGVVQDDARAAGNRISLRITGEAERAFTDASKLGVCVGALISNAVKFTNDGLIAVTAEREYVDNREWLVIAVSDTGCGIAADDLTRIFKPFTQADGAKTRTKGGMGLGLSIAHRMAHILGGDVVARSEVGAGSTFTLRVPQRIEVVPATEVRAAAA
jgi:signal transduction histidine kinase